MYAVCFPGKPDIVVQPEGSLDKIVYHLIKANTIRGKHFFIILDRI